MGLGKILENLNPRKFFGGIIAEEVAEKTEIGIQTVLKTIDQSLPEIGDLLSGEEVTLEVKIRLKQRGEK